MKALIAVLIGCTIVFAELPPPYPHRGFRPSPQFGPSRTPHVFYGAPQKINVLDVNIPSKLTIDQLIRITEHLQHSRGKMNKPQPFNTYLPPPRQTFGPTKQQIRPGSILPPQISYGAPNNQQQNQNFRPSQVYGAPPNIGNQQNSFQAPAGQKLPNLSPPVGFANQQTPPSSSYGAPLIPETSNFDESSQSNISPGQLRPPSTSYGTPFTQQLPASSQSNNFATNTQGGANSDSFKPPSSSYGVPFTQQSSNPSSSNSFTNSNSQTTNFDGSQSPLSSYGTPLRESQSSRGQASSFPGSNLQTPPATSYGVPDIRNLETFGDFRDNFQNRDTLQQNILRDLAKQHLPSKNPVGFRSQDNTNFVSQDYLPAKEDGGPSSRPQTPVTASESRPTQGNVQPTDVGENYLPPITTTTAKPVVTTTPKVVSTTIQTPQVPNYDYDYDLQPTESPSNQNDSEADPNISISNAVAGGGGFFYLQQPDGRLQKVVLEKNQEPNSKPEEYVANYYFQNIPSLPNQLYAPLINLGSLSTK
ncbi:uncharacterized protein LOC143199016 [Rhynchophorus ferrugineus]|uniref:uncharacterized protein LOC143199016 n=1 Tax=Rhynchophorus ferrugineus TaxID=354439 RepID=UPI003FCDE6E2